MLANPSTRGLIWKETRQILPLIAIVIGVGVLVLFVGTIVSSLSRQTANFGSAIAWVLPA